MGHGGQEGKLTPGMSLAGTSWGRVLGLQDFANLAIWRAAMVELVAVWVFVFSSILIAIGSNNHGFSSPLVLISFAHFLLVSLIIRATAPPSGAHFNPGITLSAMFAGQYSPVRTLIYICFQGVGGVFGAICAKDVLPIDQVDTHALGGCIVRTTTLLDGGGTSVQGLLDNQAFLVEFFFSFVLQWMNFSVAMDERQFKESGLQLFPFLLGATVGLNIYVSNGIAPGFGGASMNPVRCFGPAMAYGGDLMGCLWIFLLAPAVAALASGFLYNIVLPNHVDIYREKTDFLNKVIFNSKPSHNSPAIKLSKPAGGNSTYPALDTNWEAKTDRANFQTQPLHDDRTPSRSLRSVSIGR